MFGLGSAFYLILFITNALAVLSEDRFLARGESLSLLFSLVVSVLLTLYLDVGVRSGMVITFISKRRKLI